MAGAQKPRWERAPETAIQRRHRERLQVSVGARVAETRVGYDWTQQELANRIGVSMRYVQGVELGEQNLSLGSLLKLAHALDIEVAELFEPAQPRVPKPGRPRRGRAV